MRVAIYNQMFGLNGKSLFSSLIGHWAIHFQNKSDIIWKRVDLNRTVQIIKKAKAEVIGICEVLEGQERELEKKLKKLGYKWIYFAHGHKTKFRNLHVKVAIASKIKCKKEFLPLEPIEDKLGGGGGFVDCYFPSLKMNIMCVHLGTRKKLREKQLELLKKIHKKREKSILMGDFNSRYDDFAEELSDLQLLSERIKSCNLTPFLKFFHFRDDDHILAKKIKAKNIGYLEGYSDHRLIYADLA